MGESEHMEDITHIFLLIILCYFVNRMSRALLNFRYIFLSFQIVFGFNINLAKSELVRLDVGRGVTMLARISGCRSVDLLIKY